MTIDHLLFMAMSATWGVTWIAAKATISAVPPIFVGAVRFIVVGAVLSILVRNVARLLTGGHAARVILSGLLVNVGTYALLFWGMLHVASGVAGLINLSLIPVFLFGLAILFGQERASWRHAAALGLGIVGLAVMFLGKADLAGDTREAWGIAAIIAATFSHSLGSVLSRAILEDATPLQLTAAHAIVGAIGLTALSLALEPAWPEAAKGLTLPGPFAGLAFLIVFGTFIAYTIYLRLVRNWGAPRAGFYAFVSPVIALVLGALVLDETLGPREIAGAALMLTAAAIAVARTRVPDETPVG